MSETLTFDLATDVQRPTPSKPRTGLGVNVEDCEAYVPGCTDEDST